MVSAKAILSKLNYHIVEAKSEKSEEVIDSIKENLSKFGIDTESESVTFPSYPDSEEFPYLPGNVKNYDELISNLANDVCGEDIRLIENFLTLITRNELPEPPSKSQIRMVQGWSQYDSKGNFVKRIDAPRDKVLVFDTETFVVGGNLPIIATATGHNRSYIWLSKEFIENIDRSEYDQYKLVPLPYTKIIIAHNAMFDVARVTEAYKLPVSIKALDTLSMNVVVSGVSSQQRYVMSILEGGNKPGLTNYEKSVLKNPPAWANNGCTNSLVSAYNFHVAKDEGFWGDEHYLTADDKEIRNLFVETEKMSDFVAMDDDTRLNLVHYAAKDTYYTAKLFRKLFPKYKQTKPHIAALAGHLLLTTSRVPVINDWIAWINECERLLEEKNLIASGIIKEVADNLFYQWCRGELTDSIINNDPFYKQLDWTLNKIKNNNPEKRFESFMSLLVNSLSDKVKGIIDNAVGDLPFECEDYKQLISGDYDFIPTWYDKFFLNPNPDIKSTSKIYKVLSNYYLLDNRDVKEIADEIYTLWSNNQLDLTLDENLYLSQLNWKLKRKTIKDDNHSSIVYNKLSNLKSDIDNEVSKLYEKHPNIFKKLADLFNTSYIYIPEWYVSIYKNPEIVITPKTEISHLLLRLHWNGLSVYKSTDDGWGTYQNNKFVKIQSPGNRDGQNTGNLLGKHFVKSIDEGILTGEHPCSKEIFDIAVATSFWISTRSRMLERFFIETTTPDEDKKPFNLLCTQNIVHGAISGRQTENLFLVLCSPKPNKIGSEAKSRIQAPDGYKILSADFSGQELVLASLYGDRELGRELGSCSLGYQTLIGNKENNKDAHSATAYNLFLKDKGYRYIDGEWYLED